MPDQEYSCFSSIPIHRLIYFVGPAAELESSAQSIGLRGDVAVRRVQGSRCQTLAEFMAEWAVALQFPDDFTPDWGSFESCLSSLAWIREPNCAIYVMDADQVLARSHDHFVEFRSVLYELSQRRRINSAQQVLCAFVLHCASDNLDVAQAGFGRNWESHLSNPEIVKMLGLAAIPKGLPPGEFI